MDSAVTDYNEKGSKFAAGRSYQGNAGIVGDGTNSTGAMELTNFCAIRVARPDRYHRLIRHRAKYLQALRPFQQNRLGQRTVALVEPSSHCVSLNIAATVFVSGSIRSAFPLNIAAALY